MSAAKEEPSPSMTPTQTDEAQRAKEEKLEERLRVLLSGIQSAAPELLADRPGSTGHHGESAGH